MDTESIVARLTQNATLLARLVSDVEEEEARWKPEPKRWSILEVMNHLACEERDDFRTRLDYTLHQPEVDWPGIDPEEMLKNPAYGSRTLRDALADFSEERERSIAWLKSLSSPDWNSTHRHPQFKPISAGDLAASWIAHDYLHLRQIVTLRNDFLSKQVLPFSTLYAG